VKEEMVAMKARTRVHHFPHSASFLCSWGLPNPSSMADRRLEAKDSAMKDSTGDNE
jgi:hypothetical protein